MQTSDSGGASEDESTSARSVLPGMTEATIRTAIAQLAALLPERALTIRQLWDRHQVTLPDAQWKVCMASTMKLFLAQFGEMRVSEFTAMTWEGYRDDPAVRARFNVTTRSIQLRRLKACFNWAVATNRIPFNPLDHVKPEKAKPKRETELSHDGEAELLRGADPLMRAYILAALDGGMRRDEVRLLEWADVNFKAGTLVLHAARTKSKKQRIVRLTPRALDAIQMLPRHNNCPFIFANPKTMRPFDATLLWRRWRKAADEAGLAPAPGDGTVRYHDLRGSCITRLARLGAPVPVIQRLVGHGSATTTLTYIRVNAKDVEDAYALLAKSQRRGPHRVDAQSAAPTAKKKARA